MLTTAAHCVRDALTIYLNESDAADGRKFRGDALHVVNRFVCLLGDLKLSELRHIHACMLRDHLLKQGLKPVTIRKQTAILNAMINVAFKHLDVDRLSPFRSLKISGDDSPRPMRAVTRDLLVAVKNRLLTKPTQFKYVGLLQLNTGLRLSEPVFARLEDCVLKHPIPHLWIRRNELSKRKNKSSIRAVPLVGVSLHAAEMPAEIAKYPNRFQKQCVANTQAQYSLLPNGEIQVLNRCLEAQNKVSEAVGRAKQIGPADSPKLKVRFAPSWLSFLPMVWGDYWIIELDENYQWVAVSEPQREYLWVLSRQPQMDASVYQALLQRLQAHGFDLKKIETSVQR